MYDIPQNHKRKQLTPLVSELVSNPNKQAEQKKTSNQYFSLLQTQCLMKRYWKSGTPFPSRR